MTIRKFDYTTADFERYVKIRNNVVNDQPRSVQYEKRFLMEWPLDQLFERLLVENPRGQTLATANEETNPMLQINLRLGFKEIPAWLIYAREEGEE